MQNLRENMRVAAIISEFNPLHNGHLRLIESVKRTINPDYLIVVMNGDFSQRGELTVLDKYIRATHAIKANADLVLELPTIFGVSCAERFANAGVKILSTINAEEKYLCFGSESGDLSELKAVADLLDNEPNEVKCDIENLLDMGVSYPVARETAINNYTEKNSIKCADIKCPNNILAVEYLRAIKNHKGIIPFTIKRDGDYHSEEITNDIASASAIRKAINENNLDKIKSTLPDFVFSDIQTATTASDLSPIILYKLSQISANGLSRIADVNEGIENRILRLAKECDSIESLVQEVCTKRYTASKIRRILINALLGVNKQIFESAIDAPVYFKVLATKKTATQLLSLLSKSSPVITGEKETETCGNPFAKFDSEAHDIYKIAKKLPNANDGMIII